MKHSHTKLYRVGVSNRVTGNLHSTMFKSDVQSVAFSHLNISSVNQFDDMFSRFDRISACDRRTDGQTHRQTEILREHSPRYAWHPAVKTVHDFDDIAGVFEFRANSPYTHV